MQLEWRKTDWTNAEIVERLCWIIKHILPRYDKEPTAIDRLYDDLGADSVDFVEVIMRIEEVFDISIDDKTVDHNISVGELAERVKHELAQA